MFINIVCHILSVIQQATMRLKIPFSKGLFITMQEFSKAVQISYDYARCHRISSLVKLHRLLYRRLRNETVLPAQLCCKAIKVAIATKRGCKSREAIFSKELSIQYDQRSYRFDFDGRCSLLTLDGREKMLVKIPEYFLRKYRDSGYEVTSATLSCRRSDMFLNVVVSKEIPFVVSMTSRTVGVDMGINNIAVTSDRKFYGGGEVKEKLHRIRRLQEDLVAKGTKSAKRHIRKLNGRRKRFMRDINHNISKSIVGRMESGDVVALEDLRGIRGRRLGKKLNVLLSNWSFGSLREMITYKASAKGILVVAIPPHYTSKTCGRCHETTTTRPKHGGFVKCSNCGYSCNSDLNASAIIRSRVNALRNTLGLFVNQPIVGAPDEIHDFVTDKPHPLGCGY